MLINELSAKSGISKHTIRFYEKSGLITGQRLNENKTNNYLLYHQDSLDKLDLITEAKSAGFTLLEIKQLINLWYNHKLSQTQKIKILNTKLDVIDDKINQMKAIKKTIKSFIKDIEKGIC
jgi:MerR family transcriptional regulator, copper efflux regulator